MITVILNGEEKKLEQPVNLTELLNTLQVDTTHIAVALNNEVIPKTDFNQTLIREGDRIEMMTPVGGG